MYAVVRTGGKQYKVAKDSVLKVETLAGDVGAKLDLEVLMLGGDSPKIGAPLVKGRRVTGFTNSEEAAVQLTDIVPFLVEDMLKANGGDYSKAADWHPYAVTDGLLITGQNPASSELAAQALLKLLG